MGNRNGTRLEDYSSRVMRYGLVQSLLDGFMGNHGS